MPQKATRVAYKPVKITISAPQVKGEELITVLAERMELDADGQVLARNPADEIFAIKASDLSQILPGQVDGAQIKAAVEMLSNSLIAARLNLEIGESGYAEEAV